MVQSGVVLPEQKGIARKLDYSYSGPQAARIARMLFGGKIELGAVHTYLELFARYFIDLTPNVALIAAVSADKDGNLHTGPKTEDTPTVVVPTTSKSGVVVAQVAEIVDRLPRVDIPGDQVHFVAEVKKPFFVEPLFTRDPAAICTVNDTKGAVDVDYESALTTGRFGRVRGFWAHRKIGLHIHDEIQITFNLGGGQLHYKIGDALVMLKPGQGVTIPSWVKHSRDVDPTAPTYLIVMAISPAWLQAHRAGYNISGGRRVFTVPGPLEKILANLRLSFKRTSLDVPQQVAAFVDALIDSVILIMGPAAPLLSPVNLKGYWDQRIMDAAKRIQKCNGRIVVDHLAKEYGLSRSHFYSRFCAHFGFAPQLLINAVRMKTALHLLLETDDSIATISDTLDFSTPGHFTRFFTKHTGETPMSYRTINLTLESL
jgi:AraC-like DNA-binding protein